RLNLRSYDIGGDEGYGHQIMDRMQEEGFYLQRFNNGSPAKRSEIFANLSAEWWSIAGQLIEQRKIVLSSDEKLVAQLTSRRKLYASRGRERLESKADLRARGVESPDRADAVIGALVLAQNRYSSLSQTQEIRELIVEIKRRAQRGGELNSGTF